MKRQRKRIKLSQIEVEDIYRNEEKDLNLRKSIEREGLKSPLVVEQRNDEQYVLVDGYRRIDALKSLKITEADCFVEPYTSVEERIIKRLKTELETRNRNAYQLERMIKRLLDSKSYDVKVIADRCNVTEATIKKYIRGLDVDREQVSAGEKAGLARETVNIIHFLNVDVELKKSTYDKARKNKISSKRARNLNRVTKEEFFKDLSDKAKEKAIDKILEHKSTDYEKVKESVIEECLEKKYTKENHQYMFEKVLKLLARLEAIFRMKYFVEHITPKQRERIIKSLEGLMSILKQDKTEKVPEEVKN